MNSTKSYCKNFLFILFFFPLVANSQDVVRHIKLEWKDVQVVDQVGSQAVKALFFSGAVSTSLNRFSPLYHTSIVLPQGVTSCNVVIKNSNYEVVDSKEIEKLTYPLEVYDSLNIVNSIGIARGIPSLDIRFIPLLQPPGRQVQKLVSFDLEITYTVLTPVSGEKKVEYAANSVLSAGNWYKIRVNKTGICKVTYDDISNMGVNMTTVAPDHIRLFGKNGGMLPEGNFAFRYDDLPENAIQVITATPGVFAPGDYFLFYAMDPNEVVFNKSTRKLEHKLNLYSDYTYYFLNFDGAEGKRTGVQEQSTEAIKYTCNTFIDFSFHEKDLYNPIKSGKQWIGERLDYASPSLDLTSFNFQNVETGKQAWIRYRLVARASATSNFSITVNSSAITSRTLSVYGENDFTREAIEVKTFVPVEGQQQVSIRYNTPNNTALGYIDWLEMNVPRKMIFTGGQMIFSDPVSVASGNITDYRLQGASQQLAVWEVTDPVNVNQVMTTLEGDLMHFVLPTDTIRRFVAWDNTSFNSVEFVEKVDNQNLHSITGADLLIVTHPDFLEQANRLADHHRLVDGMSVVVVTNQLIYNEFSSGSPDVSAIRDFARMLYLRPEGEGKLKYLLLFGDGSYDYKDIMPTKNTNYVLAFETFESQNTVSSFASDDFYALFDPNEGNDAFGKLDIGVGRFTVDDTEQAKNMVDKCIRYSTAVPETFGNWRNSLCFVADDEDNNTHIRQVEDQVTPVIEKNDKVFNISKVYLDAYQQVSTPSGARYPEVNAKINEEVQKGVLMMNYTGHGGETGWAEESVLTLHDINSWTNYDRLSVFFTATCEFSRFDDPARVSAGEQVFLNPAGGAVALFSTTRLANAGTNVELTVDFYDTIFKKLNGKYPRFGDAIAFAKNNNSNTSYIRNFLLIGDPAMQLAYPRYNVLTTMINGQPVVPGADTLSAMNRVDLEGMVADAGNNQVLTFNGTVDVKVYDKFRWLMTRGNDPSSFKRYFSVQDNILFQGKATVTNGLFAISFIVPRDIDYSFGFGKISYYANSESIDAAGYNDSIVIGGTNTGYIADTQGPVISMYMNDERFKDGGITSENPMLLAYIIDESGINTVGNGIGHDIVATLDGSAVNSVVLNEFYQPDLDSYRSGKVTYNYANLAEGPHTLKFKAWDVFNNSSEASINFTVKKNLALAITSVKGYPNPFNQEIRVEFEHNVFNSTVDATLDIFKLDGTWIRSIGPQSFYSQGYLGGAFTWDGRNSSGSPASKGIYLLRIHAGTGNNTSDKTIRVVKIP